MSALKQFRTLSGPERKAAMRAHLIKVDAVVFGLDPHGVTWSQQLALAEMAKVVAWKKSISSPLSLGLAFYVYLSRDVAKPAPQRKPGNGPRRMAFGRGVAMEGARP